MGFLYSQMIIRFLFLLYNIILAPRCAQAHIRAKYAAKVR